MRRITQRRTFEMLDAPCTLPWNVRSCEEGGAKRTCCEALRAKRVAAGYTTRQIRTKGL